MLLHQQTLMLMHQSMVFPAENPTQRFSHFLMGTPRRSIEKLKMHLVRLNVFMLMHQLMTFSYTLTQRLFHFSMSTLYDNPGNSSFSRAF